MAPRTSASEVTFSLGLLQMKADLYPARVSAGKSFSMLCRDCETPTKVTQSYNCDQGHGPFVTGDLDRRYKEVDGNIVEVSAEEIKAAKGDTGIPDKSFDITVYDADDVEEYTVSDSGVYRVKPRNGATAAELKVYRMFLEAAANRDIALIAEFLVSKAPKMGRLGVFKGQLVINTLIRPDDIAEVDTIENHEPTEKERALFSALLEASKAQFDPATYANVTKERLAALVAARAADPDAVVTMASPIERPAADDLEAALEAMLAAKAA